MNIQNLKSVIKNGYVCVTVEDMLQLEEIL